MQSIYSPFHSSQREPDPIGSNKIAWPVVASRLSHTILSEAPFSCNLSWHSLTFSRYVLYDLIFFRSDIGHQIAQLAFIPLSHSNNGLLSTLRGMRPSVRSGLKEKRPPLRPDTRA
jgi:hypothetical protein